MRTTLALALMGLAVPACSHTPAPAPTAQAVLPTPEASFPAAGVCQTQRGATASIDIEPDVPMPRCLKIHPAQRLRLTNRTSHPIVARVGRLSWRMEPGASRVTVLPIGRYLAAGGVHRIRLSRPPGAAELWVLRA